MKRMVFTEMAAVAEQLKDPKTKTLVVDGVPIDQLEFVQLRDAATARPVEEYAERLAGGSPVPAPVGRFGPRYLYGDGLRR